MRSLVDVCNTEFSYYHYLHLFYEFCCCLHTEHSFGITPCFQNTPVDENMTYIGPAIHFVISTFIPRSAYSVHLNKFYLRYVTVVGSCEKSNESSGFNFLTRWATTSSSKYTLFHRQSYMVTISRMKRKPNRSGCTLTSLQIPLQVCLPSRKFQNWKS
jgi:hypothetical protein